MSASLFIERAHLLEKKVIPPVQDLQKSPYDLTSVSLISTPIKINHHSAFQFAFD